MDKQYFYLVAAKFNEDVTPLKIFLQEYQAVKWGRKELTKALEETINFGYDYVLYRQEITTNGILEYVRVLYPYQKKSDLC